MTKAMADKTLFCARLLIAALFLGGAIQKTTSPEGAADLLQNWAMPAGLIYLALAYNALAGFALVVGVQVRSVALSLAAYCAFTSIFHWIPADPWQISIFVKNWAVSGGCLALAVAGSGRIAMRPDRPMD
ncbi:DoxX family protein [Yoonia sp. MH D7]